MSATTKAKINLKDGIIELEGSENFVTKQLDNFAQKIGNLTSPFPQPPKPDTDETGNDASQGAAVDEKRRRKKNATPRIVPPLPLDLKKTNERPSLKEFYDQKKPKTDMERATVFAYYLKRYLNIKKIEPGHVVSCCKDVSAKVPSDIGMTFYNAQNLYAWLQLDETGKAEISIQGENMVESLPRKKDVSKDKTTA
ncbi:MAG: hypothetical protein ABSG33_00390 [Candidatus Bathyarchaeia archaeon]|jgi:hypothetical protein